MDAHQVQAPIEQYENNLITINENTLKANLSITYEKPQILGTIIEPLIPEIIALVINCESGWNQSARGEAGEIGIAQFMPSTWKRFNELRGTNSDIYNAIDQLDMIQWAFKNGYASHWTCWRQLSK